MAQALPVWQPKTAPQTATSSQAALAKKSFSNGLDKLESGGHFPDIPFGLFGHEKLLPKWQWQEVGYIVPLT